MLWSYWEQRVEMPTGDDGKLQEMTLRKLFTCLVPLGLKECKDLPYIPESWFKGKLPFDKDSAGQDSIRDPARLDFSRHRTMIINHENNRLLIEEEVEKLRINTWENTLRRIGKCNEYFNDNEECEKLIRQLAKIEDDQPIVNVEIKVFNNRLILKDKLIAFTKLRDNKDKQYSAN